MSETTRRVSLPYQRVSLSKQSERDFYVATMEHYISLAYQCKDMSLTEACVNASNGVIDESVYKYLLQPLRLTSKVAANLPQTMNNSDIITPIVEKQVGEYINLPYNFAVLRYGDTAIADKNKHIYSMKVAAIRNAIAEQLQIVEQAKQSGASEEEIQQVIQQQQARDIQKEVNDGINSYLDEQTIKAQDLLDIVNKENSFDEMRYQAFYDFYSTEEFYTYRYIYNGELYKDSLNPLTVYPINNGEMYVEDMTGLMVKESISYDIFIEHYRDLLSKKDIEYIDNYIQKNISDLSSSGGDIVQMFGRKLFETNDIKLDANTRYSLYNANKNIDHITICYKAEVEIYKLQRYNEDMTISTIEVDKSYELNLELGDIQIDKEWIQETRIGHRFGNAFSGVYIEPVAVEVQRYDSKGHCKLPYGGRVGILQNKFINPVPYRIREYQAFYRILYIVAERTIAKYKAAIQLVPQSMVNDDESGTTEQKLISMDVSGTLIFDDTKVDAESVKKFAIVGNNGLEGYIKLLYELGAQTKKEAWDLANMNDARAGQASPSEAVRNNERNLTNARLGSALSNVVFNNALEKDHQADLEFAKYCYRDGKHGIVKDYYGNVRPIHITLDDSFENLLVSVENSNIADSQLQQYKELAFSMGQNGSPELSDAAIRVNSPSKLSKMIKQFSEEKRQFEQQMAEQEKQNQMEIQQQAAQIKDREIEASLLEIRTKELLITEREITLQEMEMQQSANAVVENDSEYKERDLTIKEALSEHKMQLEKDKLQLEKDKQSFLEKDANVKNSMKKQEMKQRNNINKS